MTTRNRGWRKHQADRIEKKKAHRRTKGRRKAIPPDLPHRLGAFPGGVNLGAFLARYEAEG